MSKRHGDESVLAELKQFRSKIPAAKLREWEAPTGWKCGLKISQDWAMLLLAHQLFVRRAGLPSLCVALLLMSWGQRGLSCLAHDSIHRNLVKNRKLNDLIADAFLAPPAMSTAKLQRHGHDLHHRFLGSPLDPDHGANNETSLKHYREGHYAHKTVWALFVYDVLDPVLFTLNALGSFAEAPVFLSLWWAAATGVTVLLQQPARPGHHALFAQLPWFPILFHVARCTLSYAVYVLREIIDHSGLQSSSVLEFTRSSPWGGPLQKFLQPHDDNYHLLHHLLPKIPMSSLHDADVWLKANCKEYAAAHHYENYFQGDEALFMQRLHEHGVFGDPDSAATAAEST